MRFHPDFLHIQKYFGGTSSVGIYLLIKSPVLMELVLQEERHNKKQT